MLIEKIDRGAREMYNFATPGSGTHLNNKKKMFRYSIILNLYGETITNLNFNIQREREPSDSTNNKFDGNNFWSLV